jgi:predicted Zn-dependent protease
VGRRLRALGDRLPPAIRGRRLLLVGAGLLVLILAITLPLSLRRGRQRKGLDQQHQQALALIERGSFRTLQKADTVLVKLLQADPTQARSRSARIYIAALLAAEFGESAQLADELIERGQAAPDPMLAAGKILAAMARADLTRAASEAERFDGKYPRSALLAQARCLLSVRQGDPGHAVQLLEDRPTADLPVLLGRCRTAALLGLGRPADALAALQRVPDSERRAPWAVLLEARIHLAQGAADLPAQLRSDVGSILEDAQGWTSALQKRWAHAILAELAGRQAQDARRRELLGKAQAGSPLDDPALDELLADHLLRFDSPLPAAQVARALKVRYPRRVASSLVLAQVALAAGDAKAALAELEAQPRVRDLPAATVARSRAQILLGQVAEARDGLSRLRRDHPGRIDGHLAWAALLAREGKVKEALAELEELLRRTPRDVAIIREAARLELLRGQAAGAVTRLEVAVPLRPGDPTLHAELVHAYLAAGAYKSADSALASALTAFPAAAGLLVAQGRLRLALGQLAEAAQSFAAALKGQAGLPDALVGQAEAHLLAGQLEAARPAVAAATAAQPELQPLLEGWLALLSGTRPGDGLDLAERRLNTATTLGSEDAVRRAAVLLVELQAKRLDKARARRVYTRLRDKLGDHPELRSAYALALVEADENGKARDEIASARSDARFAQLRPPVRAETLARLAQSQWQEGSLESAASTAKQAQDLWAGCARALAVTGIVAYERNQYGDARTWLEKAVAANPLLDLAHHYLGMALRHLGERDKARTHLREYLRLRPKGPLAEDTRRALD